MHVDLCRGRLPGRTRRACICHTTSGLRRGESSSAYEWSRGVGREAQLMDAATVLLLDSNTVRERHCADGGRRRRRASEDNPLLRLELRGRPERVRALSALRRRRETHWPPWQRSVLLQGQLRETHWAAWKHSVPQRPKLSP